ncbi:MAG: DUF2203 domain-containing protein [Gemmataceae bacterium]|nr:DUF2203 domain-containing protein [Gemmataceae bacterium]
MLARPSPPTKKYFTREQANAMLPLVRSIVTDICDLAQRIEQRRRRLQQSQATGRSGLAFTDAQLEEEQAAWERETEQFKECVDELTRLGVELKDPMIGLVDFPCWRDGREVYLCWKLGEAEIGWWHELHTGYAGRRPL